MPQACPRAQHESSALPCSVSPRSGCAGVGIPVERVEGRVVRAQDVVAQLGGVPAGRRRVPVVAGGLARPEQQRRVHQAVDDGAAALARVVEVAPGLDDAGRLEDPGHQVVGRGQGGVAGPLVAGAPPGRHARQRVEEAEVVGVEVDAALAPGRRSCPHATVPRARNASSPVRSWASQSMPGQKLVVQPTLAPSGWPAVGRPQRVDGRPSVVSSGYRSPKAAMFASTVRSAAADRGRGRLGVGALRGRRSPS